MMEKKKKAIELTITLNLNQTIIEYSRLIQYSLFIQTHLIKNIPEIWDKMFMQHSPNLLSGDGELEKDLNKIMVEETVEKLPQTIWQSIFIHCYHLFESSLLNICKFLQKQNNYKITLNDLNSKGIFKSCDYLKKVIDIDFPDTSREWQQIQIYNKIRNTIVHNNAIITDKNTNEILINYIEKNENIEINENGLLKINFNYITSVIDNYISIIKILLHNTCPNYKIIENQISNMKKDLS